MSENLDDNGKAGEDRLQPQVPPANAGIDASRRRFTAAGIAASGAVLTLASRPVLGQGLCTPGAGLTISGWASGNLSNHHVNTVDTGKSPGYWKTHSTKWPAGAPAPSTMFKDFFKMYAGPLTSKVTCNGGVGAASRYVSLLDALSAEIYNEVFGRSLVCAYLNALNHTPVRPTIDEVKLMAAKTFKPPGATSPWKESDICCFLAQTFL